MIIACPACMTRYAVPDTAIGLEGRTVRCAKCRHNWFQEGPALAAANIAPEATSEQRAEERNQPTANSPEPADAAEMMSANDAESAPFIDDNHGDVDTASSDDSPLISSVAKQTSFRPSAGKAVSRGDARLPFSPRRNRLRLWTWVAAIFAALALGAIVAIYAWGLPNWVPVNSPTFAAAQPELQLDFPLDQQERRQLPNGTEYFGASGTITNAGSVSHEVPPILIVLRDDQERIVYSWEVMPPQRTLAPGETMAINEAVTDVPRSARVAEIGWKPD